MGRKSKGRQKLEMVKIPNESNLMVTFSKRRSGLFKKASELSTLCGAEVTIIVFSPGKKVFSFGHPCVEQVIDRFLTGNLPQTSGALQLIEAHRSARVRQLNMQLTQVLIHQWKFGSIYIYFFFWFIKILKPQENNIGRQYATLFFCFDHLLGAQPIGNGEEAR